MELVQFLDHHTLIILRKEGALVFIIDTNTYVSAYEYTSHALMNTSTQNEIDYELKRLKLRSYEKTNAIQFAINIPFEMYLKF